MFSMFIYLCLCILYAAYVQMGANWCKCMLHCTSNIYWGIFSYFISELFVQCFNSSQVNYLCKALTMYRIMGEMSSKHEIRLAQSDGIITYIKYSKKCVQKVTSQYNGVSDWDDNALLSENLVFNY